MGQRPGEIELSWDLAHDPEKWEPIFGKDHAPAKT
jgi:hypothetical protein